MGLRICSSKEEAIQAAEARRNEKKGRKAERGAK